MSTIAKYTAFENLTRIEMEKTVNFVVVQGESDAPIYESVITSILPEEIGFWDEVHVGGKSNIRILVTQCGGSNFICSELYGINFNALKSFNYFCRPN
jgi:hypothetical protein